MRNLKRHKLAYERYYLKRKKYLEKYGEFISKVKFNQIKSDSIITFNLPSKYYYSGL